MKLHTLFNLFLPLQSNFGTVDDKIISDLVAKFIPIIPNFPLSPI